MRMVIVMVSDGLSIWLERYRKWQLALYIMFRNASFYLFSPYIYNLLNFSKKTFISKIQGCCHKTNFNIYNYFQWIFYEMYDPCIAIPFTVYSYSLTLLHTICCVCQNVILSWCILVKIFFKINEAYWKVPLQNSAQRSFEIQLRLQDTQRFVSFRISSNNEDGNKDQGQRKRSKFK